MTGDTAMAGVSVVFRGAFNPATFHPAWFAKTGLLAEGDAQDAKIGVIHPQITDFQAADLQVQVTSDLFTINSFGKAIPDLAFDLAVGTFTLLSSTPLTMVGVNHLVHFEIDDEKAWHQVGHELLPKEFWRKFFDEPGLQSLTVRNVHKEFKRDDGYKGFVDIKVEPSAIAKPFGLFAYINDHVQIGDVQKPTDAEEIVAALKGLWPGAVERAGLIFGTLHALIVEVAHGHR